MAVCMRAGGGGFDQFRMRLRVYCLAWVYGSNGAKKPRRNRVLWSRTHLIIAFIVDSNIVELASYGYRSKPIPYCTDRDTYSYS